MKILKFIGWLLFNATYTLVLLCIKTMSGLGLLYYILLITNSLPDTVPATNNWLGHLPVIVIVLYGLLSILIENLMHTYHWIGNKEFRFVDKEK